KAGPEPLIEARELWQLSENSHVISSSSRPGELLARCGHPSRPPHRRRQVAEQSPETPASPFIVDVAPLEPLEPRCLDLGDAACDVHAAWMLKHEIYGCRDP